MQDHRLVGPLGRFIVAVMLLAFSGAPLANGNGGLAFHAVLSGEQEVPVVETPATARVRVDFDRGLASVRARLMIDSQIMVVAAHFHCGRPGTNGPVAFGLLNPGPLMEVTAGVTRVSLSTEDFTGADCEPVVDRPVNNIAALALAMRDGLIYINLHSPSAPDGELRGQMLEVR